MIPTKVCKICKGKVSHIAKGMYPNGKDFRYVDDFGRQWNGGTCGSCHMIKCRERAQAKAAAKNANN
jgi:hypothetical protein